MKASGNAGFKVFIEEGVDVAILEVGLGGRLDATNIVPHPVVCGVSSLGFDHMELLGYTLRVGFPYLALIRGFCSKDVMDVLPSRTISQCHHNEALPVCRSHRAIAVLSHAFVALQQEIATEKAGIFKPGSPALTIPQEEEAHQALEVSIPAKSAADNVQVHTWNPWKRISAPDQETLIAEEGF